MKPLNAPAQLRARLAWEASCERLRVTLEPPAGLRAGTPAEIHEALCVAEHSLAAMREAFGVECPEPDADGPQSDGRGFDVFDVAQDSGAGAPT